MSVKSKRLHHFIEHSQAGSANDIYVKSTKASHSYSEVYALSSKFRNILEAQNIVAKDRVVIYSSKNVSSIAIMIASSFCGAIYVPLSSINPASRALQIIKEAAPKFIVCDLECKTELFNAGKTFKEIYIDDEIVILLNEEQNESIEMEDDIAFILFTSGSTGTPKGVVISHEAAIVFVEWAAEKVGITQSDIISSIAPFNFDLSVFDIYVSAMKGATLCLYTETETKNALWMAMQIAKDKVSTIYGTPTFYTTLAYYGKLSKYDFVSLKNVLFAGEVFHLENFHKLLEYWPDKKYFNWYGPTETNVCTYFDVDAQNINYPTFPIGKACAYAEMLLLDEMDNVIEDSAIEGELVVAGQSVFYKYWKDIEKTNQAFYIHSDSKRYYRTGDIVMLDKDGNYVYVARRDRMIKKNGYRIEPSEVEKIIVTYPGISNAVVLFSKEKNYLICVIESIELVDKDIFNLKIFCQKFLPLYMIPDKFVILVSMPKTSSGKIDLQALKEHL